ncbi:MAG: polyprenyl synthetase family protein [Terriglobales bacterium]|jgi:geranylgeranyl diphosphate synthase type II
MLKQILEQGRAAADAALERLLPAATEHPTSIHQAMRHSVFAGGKRLRPILCMEAGRMITAVSLARASRAAAVASSPCYASEALADIAPLPAGIESLGAALEMLHTYSLIHDDLPALDNDDLRRGRPTCHKAFGEAIAILAGDALQTQAYEVLAQLRCPAEARVAIIREIAHATGTIDGMIGGQVIDLEAEHKKPDLATLEYIHRSKTAALITASVVSGGLYAGADLSDTDLSDTDSSDTDRLRIYGQSIGLAFQIVDDVLDVTQTSEQLGKTAGKDTAAEKATYPALFGVEESLHKADALVERACTQLDKFGDRATTLKDLARYLVARKN